MQKRFQFTAAVITAVLVAGIAAAPVYGAPDPSDVLVINHAADFDDGRELSAVSMFDRGAGSGEIADDPVAGASNKVLKYTAVKGSSARLHVNPGEEMFMGYTEISFDVYCDQWQAMRLYNGEAKGGTVGAISSLWQFFSINSQGAVVDGGAENSPFVKDVTDGKWHNITMTFDYEDGKVTYTRYLDGELFKSVSAESKVFGVVKALLLGGYEGAGVTYYDNLRISKYAARPKTENIEAQGSTVTLTMNERMAAAQIKAENFTFSCQGEMAECIDASLDSSGKVITLTSRYPLYTAMDYEVHINAGVVSELGASVGENFAAKFITAADDFDITRAAVSGTEVPAEIQNKTGESRTAVMVLVYKKGDMISRIKASPKTTIESGGTPTTISLPIADADGCTVEAFFIDAWETSRPIKNVLYKLS